jgi:hypothetical protein
LQAGQERGRASAFGVSIQRCGNTVTAVSNSHFDHIVAVFALLGKPIHFLRRDLPDIALWILQDHSRWRYRDSRIDNALRAAFIRVLCDI